MYRMSPAATTTVLYRYASRRGTPARRVALGCCTKSSDQRPPKATRRRHTLNRSGSPHGPAAATAQPTKASRSATRQHPAPGEHTGVDETLVPADVRPARTHPAPLLHREGIGQTASAAREAPDGGPERHPLLSGERRKSITLEVLNVEFHAEGGAAAGRWRLTVKSARPVQRASPAGAWPLRAPDYRCNWDSISGTCASSL